MSDDDFQSGIIATRGPRRKSRWVYHFDASRRFDLYERAAALRYARRNASALKGTAEARYAYLALAFIKGRPYRVVEQSTERANSLSPAHAFTEWRRVLIVAWVRAAQARRAERMRDEFGRALVTTSVHKDLLQRITAWIEGSEAHYLYGSLIAARPIPAQQAWKFEDTLAYKEERDQARKAALDELATISQELGGYTEIDR